MAFKNVEIALRLQIAGFTAGLGAASAQASAFGKQLSTDLGEAKSKDLEKIGKAGLVAGGLLLAGFGLAAKTALDFEKAMSNVQAATGATGSEMGLLRQQALDLGAATTFSASEAAQAQAELAKAGLSTSQILGGALAASLNLAAAGSLDLGTAAEYVADSLTIFDLKAGAASHVADVLAAGAGKSSTDVDGLAQALSQTGLVADQFGISLDETVGTLSLFASEGLKGSDAGTSLKAALQRLANPTGEVRDLMRDLGIDVFDSQGKFVGLAGTADELKDALSGMTVEQRTAVLAQIGGADAVRSLSILYETGGEGVRDWTQAVAEAGYAGEQAATMTDNLAGDVEQLGGALETALIEGGSKATGALRFLTQTATDGVNAFGELPGVVQTGAVAFAGLGGTAIAAVGGMVTLVPKIREAKSVLEGMGKTGQLAASGIGALGGATAILTPLLLAGGFAYADYAKTKADARAATEEFLTAIQAEEAGIEGSIQGLAKKKLAESEVGGLLRANSADYDVLTEGIKSQSSAIEVLDDKQRQIVEGGQSVADLFEEAGIKSSAFTDELVRLIDNSDLSKGQILSLIEALDGQADAYEGATEKNKNLADAEVENSQAAQEAASAQLELSGSATSMSEVMDAAAIDTENADKALQNYLDTLRASVDPLFGMVDALNSNRDAQAAVLEAEAELNKARQEHGPRSAEAAAAERALSDAQVAAAESGYDVWEAVATLNTALATGQVSAASARDQLVLMEQQGLIPAGTAALVMSGQFETAIARADELGETDPHVDITSSDRATPTIRGVEGAARRVPEHRNTNLTAADLAKKTIDSVKRQIFGIPTERTISVRVVASGPASVSIAGNKLLGYRHGGILDDPMVAAAGGLSWQAGITRRPTVLFGERETGGEAFIPKFGSLNRSMRVLNEAADWYGADVVPRQILHPPGAATGGPRVTIEVPTTIVVPDEMGPIQTARVERAARRAASESVATALSGAGL